MKKQLLIAVIGLACEATLVRCGPTDGYDHYGAYDVLKSQLRDPGSAQFSNEVEYEHDGWKAYCGDVNSKNGFGGYAGSTHFVIMQKKNAGAVALVGGSSSIEETVEGVIDRACTYDPSMPFVPDSSAQTNPKRFLPDDSNKKSPAS